MDETTVENIHYKIELNKLIGDEVSSNNVVNTEIRSDPWVNDLELLSSVPSPELHEDKGDNNISYSELYSKETDEAKLEEEGIDLYTDLLEIEEEERKAKQIHETEFENCKNELKKFKEFDAKNRKRIEELTTENTNLKKSISSLYRTVKNEIEFKDKSLAEANSNIRRLENMLHRRNGQVLKNDKCSNCENNSTDSKKESNSSKRKRSESPESSSKKRECKSSTPKTHETDLESEKSKRKSGKRPEHEIAKNNQGPDLQNNKDKKEDFNKQISKDAKHDKETQASNECPLCQSYQNSSAVRNSMNSRKNNDMFFSLLPDPIKNSFYEYEQDQINSLNKLKEAFIDEFFNSMSNVSLPILKSTPKKLEVHAEQLTSNKSSENKSSSDITSTPTSSSEHCTRTELVKRFTKSEIDETVIAAEKDGAQNSASKVDKNGKISKANKKDLVCLFKYRKEKIPFVEKKKFGLHKNDQKLIPEKLL